MRPQRRPILLSNNVSFFCLVIFLYFVQVEVFLRITQITDENLSDNDTDNFQVVDGGNPVSIADGVVIPAIREGLLEQAADVADGEEDVTNREKKTLLVFSFSSLPMVSSDIPRFQSSR